MLCGQWHLIGGANLHAARAPRFFALPLAENYQSADACRSFLLFWTTFLFFLGVQESGARGARHSELPCAPSQCDGARGRQQLLATWQPSLSSPGCFWAHHLHVHVYHPLHVGLHLYRNNVVYIISFSFCFFGSVCVIQPFM